MSEPDLAWEAMLEICGYDAVVTSTERGRVNAALKELRAIYPNSTNYAISIDIRARAEVYLRKYEGMPLTPQALVGNWSSCDPLQEKRGRPDAAQDTPPPEQCATCDGLRMVRVEVRSDGAEEYAPCPDCHPNPMAAGFWRYDRSRFNPPEPAKIRAAMIRLLEDDRV